MKNLRQLWIVEADERLPPLYSQFSSLLSAFSASPVAEYNLTGIEKRRADASPELVFFHCMLTTVESLQQFISSQSLLPSSSFVVVSEKQDEDLCLLALEAGADDVIKPAQLSEGYLRKMVLLAGRRYRTQLALRQSYQHILTCLEHTPNVAIQWYNEDGKVLYWNHASEHLFGWSKKETAGKTLDQLIYTPQDTAFFLSKIRQLKVAGGQFGPQEWTFRHRNGETRYCISTLFPIAGADNNTVFVCMDVDITDRKQTEKALRESEEKYYNLFSQASDAIFINTPDGHMLDVNQRALDMLGYTREEVLKMHVVDFYSPEELAARPIMRSELNNGERTFIERTILCANGDPLPVELTAQRLSDGRIIAILRDVSERKELTALVEKHRRELELIYNHISDAVFLLNIEGKDRYRFVSINSSFLAVTGFVYDEVVGRLVNEVIPQPSLNVLLKKYAEVVQTGKPIQWEDVTIFPAGEKIGIVSLMPVFTDEGRCTKLVGTVYDITARKQTETVLQQSEEKYRSLIEQQGDGIAIFDAEGHILDVNTSASDMLKYTREELHRMTINEVLLPEDAMADPVNFGLLETGASTIKQRKMQRKDGSVVETEVNAKLLYDGIFLASIRDLSERIEAQQRLKTESELSDSIINSLPGLFYLHHKTKGLLRWNKQLERISGYTAKELLHKHHLDFVPAEERELIDEAVRVVFEKGENAVEAHLLIKSGKKIPFYFTGRSIPYGGDVCFLGTGINLTPLKKLEARLSQQKVAEQKRIIRAMIDAEEKEKNKLGLELHDNVNQILSVVRMYLNILSSDAPLEEVTLDKAVTLLDNAIQEIRDLSHSLAIGYKFDTGLSGTLEELVNKVELARDFTVHLNLPDQLDELTSSKQKLAIYRIVQEQLNNIIKHAAASEVKISVESVENELQLVVADNGKGFDLSKAKKGLGLSTIINRAEALGGKASVQTEPGKGFRLSVVMPMNKP